MPSRLTAARRERVRVPHMPSSRNILARSASRSGAGSRVVGSAKAENFIGLPTSLSGPVVGSSTSMSMLRAAVDTVAGRAPVLLDSGVRRGIDIFRALALGATAVGIGRPALWGLAAGGSLGVKSVYAQLASELKSAMLLSGVAKVTNLNRDNLAKV